MVRMALALQVMIQVEEAMGVVFLARGGFFQRLAGWLDQVREVGPGLGEHLGIVHCHLIRQVLADAPQPLDIIMLGEWKLRFSGYPQDHELSKPLIGFSL